MRERIDRYASRLEGLSIRDLSRGAEGLVAFQRRNEAELIAHLAEISRRRGHLELGYGSLFDYCTRHLGLGKYSVWNRTQVAGISRRFPQVLERLAAGKVSLSSLGVLAPHLSEGNVDRLLAECEGKTKDEVKEIIAGLSPKPAAEPSIRRRPAPRPEPGTAAVEGQDAALPTASRAAPPRPAGSVEAARPEVYNFRFSGGRKLKEKLERLAEVLGIENPRSRMPEVIERALDLALEKRDPQRKLERRRKREAARARTRPDEAPAGARTGSAGGPPASGDRARSTEAPARDVSRSPGSAGGPPASSSSAARSRYISGAVRERVLERAGYRCEWEGSGGVRCARRSGLEIDHVRPYGKGGGWGEGNLRVLCRAHNLFAAGREYGDGFMRGKAGVR